MIKQKTILEGRYYDGIHPVALSAVLEFAGLEATLNAAGISERYPTRNLNVSPRTGQADRFITLPNGTQFQCADNGILDTLPQESLSEGLVAWFEERWGIALTCVAIIGAALLVGYFYGLPLAAKHVAAKIPIKTQYAMGRQALDWLDSNKWFGQTQLQKEKQEQIRNDFKALCSDLPFKDYYKLEFRNSSLIGANALALPGGTIVITDDLVNLAQTEEEVLAILAHEIGHIELRHTMRSILQNSIVAVVAATVTSDAASLSVAVAGMPVLLAETKYSRKFETEADDYGFKLLKRRNYSPNAFASIMERLADKHKGKRHDFSFMSTHPVTEERIKRARDAARQ
jgi:predicted Zn-dependent protease